MRYLCIVIMLFTLVMTTATFGANNEIKLVLDKGGEYSDGFVEEQWYYVDIPRDYKGSYILFMGNTMGDKPQDIDLLAKSEGSERTYVYQNEKYYKEGYDFEVLVPVSAGKRILLGVKMKFSGETAYLYAEANTFKSDTSSIIEDTTSTVIDESISTSTTTKSTNDNIAVLTEKAKTDNTTGTYYDSNSGTMKEYKPSDTTIEDNYISETSSKYSTPNIGGSDVKTGIETTFSLTGNSGVNLIELSKEKIFGKLIIKNTGKYGMWVKLVPYASGVKSTWSKDAVLSFDNRLRLPLRDDGVLAPIIEYNQQYSKVLSYENQIKEIYGVVFLMPKDIVTYKFSIKPEELGILKLGVEIYHTNSFSNKSELPIVTDNGYVGAVPFAKSINKYGHSDETFFLYDLKNRTTYFPEYNAGIHTVSLIRWIDTKSLYKQEYSSTIKVIKPLKNDTGIIDRITKYIGGD